MLSKVSFAGAVVAALTVAGSASAVVISNTSVGDRSTLLTGFTELNLATYAANSGFGGAMSGANSNEYVDSFSVPSNIPGLGTSYSGTLKAEVFGNVSTAGISLSDVVIVYTFTSNGFDGFDNVFGTESYVMGINSGFEMDYNYLTDAGTQHGSIVAESAAGQGSVVEAFDNVAANDTYAWDFLAGGDSLGGPDGAEVYTWYIKGSAGTKINLVDVTVTDNGNTTTTSLGFVTNPTQPDLDAPTPGVLALAGMGVGVMGVRRRRK